MGAMDEEIALLKQEIEVERIEKKAGMEFFLGSWEGKEVVLVQSGIGKVNAAICAQILIDNFKTDKIIFTGVAGALDPSLNIGDIVVSQDAGQHDFDVTELGYEIGEIPRLNCRFFQADGELVKLASEVASELENIQVKTGRILSGDQFIASKDKASQLREKLGGHCTEMEGAAVAQVCSLNGVPFIVIRAISDRADGGAPDDFSSFLAQAAENSLLLIKGILRKIN
ncbi:MAG TPA: 5'-methylthioadenosine/adenosylhomocysteine nucleosidase [Clostridia bacterium]|nr:5'-methylthioadenosine/adenosylhomocysteine nucleosidase [Clostridia bacterium]